MYLDYWNPKAKEYIHTCCLCGREGYSPAVLEDDFQIDLERKAIYDELTRVFDSALALDYFGRCEERVKRQDGKQ